MRVEERSHRWTKYRIAPEMPLTWVKLAFSLYIPKPQGGMHKQARFYRSLIGNWQPICWLRQQSVILDIVKHHSALGSK